MERDTNRDAVSRMGSGMETTILESVLVEFEPGFFIELAVHPWVMEKFNLERGQIVGRECMEEIIEANNEVMKALPVQNKESIEIKRQG